MMAGQGISAWSTDACAMFCSVFRILTKLVTKLEKQHVVTDAYLTELEFVNRCKAEMNKVPKLALNATTDGISFDANQNEFTQEIERKYWERVGVSEEFLEHYYSFRKNYKVISTVAMGFAGTQKTSGEPGTLVNNGIVSKIASNYIVRGDGPVCIIYKGDDFNKRQCNLRIDDNARAAVDAACALGLRINIGPTSEFCGLIFADEFLFPSIPRKINKISAHRFKDYPHFCEYQTALRDWVNNVAKLGEMCIIACNAEKYATSYEEMSAALDTIKSFSHIDEEQFKEKFKLKSEPTIIPISNLRGNIHMLMA